MNKQHNSSFFHWMSSKIKAGCSGKVLDFEANEFIPAITATSRVLLAHTHARGAYHRDQQAQRVYFKALEQAKADPNDPFAFNRCKSHLENGICALEDYSVEFRRSAIDMLDITGERIVGKKVVDFPTNMKRP